MEIQHHTHELHLVYSISSEEEKLKFRSALHETLSNKFSMELNGPDDVIFVKWEPTSDSTRYVTRSRFQDTYVKQLTNILLKTFPESERKKLRWVITKTLNN